MGCKGCVQCDLNNENNLFKEDLWKRRGQLWVVELLGIPFPLHLNTSLNVTGC